MGTLEGKVVIVTGSGSGIGRATAQRVAHEGASVVVADINLAGAEETVALILAEGGAAIAQQADVADESSARAMVEAAVREYGRLDGLHNNAPTSCRWTSRCGMRAWPPTCAGRCSGASTPSPRC